MPATDAGCEEVAALFRALSEPMRLKILRRLSRNEAFYAIKDPSLLKICSIFCDGV